MRRGIDLILPPICPVTGDFVDSPGLVSPAYWARLRFISAPFCPCCGVPYATGSAEDEDVTDAAGGLGLTCAVCLDTPPDYDRHRAALVYDDDSREIILKFKHADQTHMVRAITPWMMAAGREFFAQEPPYDAVIPVPLHYFRLVKRRYNQAGILAQAIARTTGRPFRADILKRVRATVPQGHKKAKDRRANVKNAFAAVGDLSGMRILLIDDVYTTGATVNACAAALRKGGASQIDVLSIARVVRD